MRPTSIIRAVAWAILAAGFLGLLFFGLHTFRMRLETSNSLPEYSTYRADPKGLKVLYESLRASDLIHVSRRLESSRILRSGEGQILIVAGVRADQETVSGEDVQWLDHWLTTGGRIVVALHPEQNQVTHSQAVSSANQEATEDTSSALWQSLIKRWGVEIVPLKDIRAATAESTLFGTISRWLGRNSFAQVTPDWKVIAVQGPKNVIVERAFGHGSIVLLADSYPLSNESLAADRNTDFLLWLIDNRRGVLFDETHLGLSEQPGIMTLAQRYGLQGTLISIVAVFLLFIWKCQYMPVPRTKMNQKSLAISGSSSEQAFLNLLQRSVARKDLLAVCLDTWLQSARPTSEQLAILAQFRSGSRQKEKLVAESYNQLTNLLNERR